jgi:hypothetical protein
VAQGQHQRRFVEHLVLRLPSLDRLLLKTHLVQEQILLRLLAVVGAAPMTQAQPQQSHQGARVVLEAAGLDLLKVLAQVVQETRHPQHLPKEITVVMEAVAHQITAVAVVVGLLRLE